MVPARAHQLEAEERVSLALLERLSGEDRLDRGAAEVPDDQRLDVDEREGPDRQVDPGGGSDPAEKAPHRLGGRLVVAEGSGDEDRAGSRLGHEALEQLERRRVEPLEIVDRERERPRSSQVFDREHERIDEGTTVGELDGPCQPEPRRDRRDPASSRLGPGGDPSAVSASARWWRKGAYAEVPPDSTACHSRTRQSPARA